MNENFSFFICFFPYMSNVQKKPIPCSVLFYISLFKLSNENLKSYKAFKHKLLKEILNLNSIFFFTAAKSKGKPRSSEADDNG